MRTWWAWLLCLFFVVFASACVDPSSVTCRDGLTCPAGYTCDDVHHGCATQKQIMECDGQPDFTACSYPGMPDGQCFTGVCLTSGCGNGSIDGLEVCDDGNRFSGDGCSADCLSNEVCGNGVLDTVKGEACDDGNTIDGDGCQATCLNPTCGDGIVDAKFNEQCDLGAANSNAPNATCRPNCQPKRCGDGVLDTGEKCDDGNTTSGDGCAADCNSDETCGNSVTDISKNETCDDGNHIDGDGCEKDCTSPRCGDGIIDPQFNEGCDNASANSNAPDAACRTNCLPKRCGDHIVDTGETCDDGNVISGDGCSADCKSDETCGNSYLDVPQPFFGFAGEQCDDGNHTDGDGCQGNCKVPYCGDGIKDNNLFEECDSGLANANTADTCRTTCRLPRCGDGIPDTGEVCDNGNTISGDGCSADCKSDETCGNGYVDVATGEACDPASPSPGACRLDCTIPGCGDGVLDTSNGEGCDNGMFNSNAANAACRLNCQPKRCGDDILDTGEICDDGNVASGDGCSGDCQSKETCGNGYVDTAKGETCDPLGNTNCRADCTTPRCGDNIVDAANGEGCDLGVANSNAKDAACRVNCQPKRCGDGIKDTGEVCDDGGTASGDGCSGDCQSNETCGNGYVDTAKGETCDPLGNANCRIDCTTPRCGDGIVDASNGEGCDDGVALNSNTPNAACRPNCQPQRCGDGVLDFGFAEVCDDGNSSSGDGCRGDCRSNETCGNGQLDTVNGEECDDASVFGLSRDGCTSNCKVEIPLWTNITPQPPDGCNDCDAGYDPINKKIVVLGGFNGPTGPAYSITRIWDGTGWVAKTYPSGPSARGGYAIAYDTSRSRLVLFGGGPNFATGTNETWEWDGATWTKKNPATKPPLRVMARMVYDSARSKIVLFGGSSNVTVQNDLWEYDGTNWTSVTATNPPPARQRFAMAYDAARARIVIMGGWNSSNTNLADTWTYDPTTTTWTQAVTAVISARHDPNMSYDSNRQRIVLFGGHLGSVTAFNDTYEWDGSIWALKSPATSPPTRANHAMTYDSVKHRVVVYAGIVSQNGSPLNDIWEWDGTSWTQDVPSMSPPARSNTAMAYDAARGRFVMFGGANLAGSSLGDTWEFDGTYWTKMTPATSPAARTEHTMTYDAARRKIVMFGGSTFCCTTALDELWQWDGTNWTQVPKAGTWPDGRYGAALVSDDSRGELILYGGFATATNTFVQTTYKWNGAVWQLLAPGITPQPMIAAGVYDSTRQRIVIHGTLGVSTNYTYEWTGSNWQFAASGGPFAVEGALGYHAARGATVKFGGTNNNLAYDETWEWYPGWTQIHPAVSPSGRQDATMAYDAIHAQLVMFGGSPVNNETWAYAYTSSGNPPEACNSSTADTDGDGLVGCTDPDCWGRCKPFCPPLSSCNATLPHCGDGVCSPVEDSAICPTDCP